MKALIPRSCSNLYCIGNKTYDQILLTEALHLTENPNTIDALALLGDEGICVKCDVEAKVPKSSGHFFLKRCDSSKPILDMAGLKRVVANKLHTPYLVQLATRCIPCSRQRNHKVRYQPVRCRVSGRLPARRRRRISPVFACSIGNHLRMSHQ